MRTGWRSFIAGLILSAVASHGQGQVSDAPIIQIGPSETPASPVVPAPVPVVPAPTVPSDSPAIAIEPPGAAAAEPYDPTVPPVAPLPHDAAQAVAATAGPAPPVADPRLALVPVQQFIPSEVRIGGSMPTPGQFRLTGEVASSDFLLTLPSGMPPPSTLVLSLRSSANVLAQASKLAVMVNGAEAGSVQLDNIGGFVDRSLPVTGLVPGENRIQLKALQSHRIFCGPDASFGIWTEVELARSGVSINPAEMPLNADSFMALARTQVMGGGTVDLLVDQTSDPVLQRILANQVHAAIGGTAQVTPRSFYHVQTEPASAVRVALIEGAEAKAGFRRGAGGAVVLQVEHAGTTLPDMAAFLPQNEPAATMTTLTPGDITTLAELGSDDIIGNTHFFQQDVDFLLPDDWLLLASQKAALTLHYGFSADLAQGARLLVKVNGETIRLLPLDRDGGKVLPPLDMTFRANRLSPGINTLTFEMSVPGDPADLPCTPRKTDMLVILGDSTLSVPPSPSMLQSGISRTLGRLGGDGIVVPPEIADPDRDGPALMAFGALFRPIVAGATPSRLHIVGVDSAGLVPRGDTDVTRALLQKAVSPKVEAVISKPDVPAPGKFSLGDSTGAPDTAAAPAIPDVSGGLNGSADWVESQFTALRDAAFPGTPSLTKWLTDKSGRALMLQLDPEAPDDVWLVAGPDIAMNELALRIDKLRRDRHYDLHSQALLLQNDGSWIAWSFNRPPVLLEPLSISNFRAVLGNYASWWPSLFATFTLAFALLSVIPALIYVLTTRRKGSHT